MGRVKLDLAGLKRYQKELGCMQEETGAFFEACAKELAARLLAKVIRRTPVGPGAFAVERGESGAVLKKTRGKNKGKVKLRRLTNGGTLRRGWTADTEQEAAAGKGNGQEAGAFAQGLRVERVGNAYQITVRNPVSYASYVEYGHRQTPGRFVPQIGKRLRKAWTPGQFMLTLSIAELKNEAPQVLEKKLAQFIRRNFDAK